MASKQHGHALKAAYQSTNSPEPQLVRIPLVSFKRANSHLNAKSPRAAAPWANSYLYALQQRLFRRRHLCQRQITSPQVGTGCVRPEAVASLLNAAAQCLSVRSITTTFNLARSLAGMRAVRRLSRSNASDGTSPSGDARVFTPNQSTR